MRTYAFRINCKLAGGSFVAKEREFPLRLPTPAPPMDVRVPEKSRDLTIWASGFETEADALAAGTPVKSALMLAGIVLGIGIDVGDDQPMGSPPRRSDGTPDERLQPNVHGLQVVPDIEGLRFSGLVFGREELMLTPEMFEKSLVQAQAYCQRRPLSRKEILATQLYSQSHFQSSEPAIFLTLVSAVEALVERPRRAPEVRKLICDMVLTVQAAEDLVDADRKSLIGGLNELHRQSISATCRKMVEGFLGAPSAKEFARLYSIRSTMVHSGEPPEGTDLTVDLDKLDVLVRNVIGRHISKSE